MEEPAGQTAGSARTVTATSEISTGERRRQVAELYDDHTYAELAATFGCSKQTIYRDVHALGLQPRPAHARPRYAAAEPRDCEACGREFTPEAPWKAANGRGRFCPDCGEEARRAWFVATFSIDAVYPDPEPRVCANPNCPREGEPFTPSRANAGRGFGRFCSDSCNAADRWARGRGLGALVEGYSGRARQVWRGRWGGAAAARAAAAAGTIGRRRAYTAEQEATAIAMKTSNPKLGERPIADRLDLKKRQVHEIFVRARADGRLM
jgi:hypothetical protein